MSLRGGLRAQHDDDDDDDFYGSSKGSAETQKLLMREQDDTIRTLGSSVERIQGMALRVNEELALQNRIIEEIDEDVDRTDSRLKGLQGKLSRIANDSDRGKYCVIFCLLVVLGILILLVIS
jgi:chromosome segregation ATPase